MGVWELLLIAVGLSMDAFAVSLCKGLSVGHPHPRQMLLTGGYFGGFQALMPLVGFLLGVQFQGLIQAFDHWVAFGLLALIGANMLREARGGGECGSSSFSLRVMLPLAVATSIDALAVGVTFAFLEVDILPAAALIGCVTFLLSTLGVRLGSILGARYQARAEALGGLLLILTGTKILLEHLGLLPF